MRCTQFRTDDLSQLILDTEQPEEEQTFTRREKRLYEQATGQQRKAKRTNAKRKARKVGQEVSTSRKANS